ncbi:uncharacterized protein C19orf18 homolog [Psammomys obesus]|uniref:uncharacterized protein C19orf18 homolog n=1 Tax=Psammomys obesus TaxID=48139 RepID=UPI002452C02A|nr:uncharacterized protein C19orf18 homolog [Psammomys obesus]
MDKVQSFSMFLFWFLLEYLLPVCLPYAAELTSSPGSTQLQTPKAPMEQPRNNLAIPGPEHSGLPSTTQKKDTLDPTETTHVFIAHFAAPSYNSWSSDQSITQPSSEKLLVIDENMGVLVLFKIRDAICKSIASLVFGSFFVTNFFLFLAIIPRRPGLVHVISLSSIALLIALICGLMISYSIYRLVKAEEKQQLAMLYENVEIPLLDEKEASEDEGQDESSLLHSENEELEKFIGSVIRTKRREKIMKKKRKEEKNLLKESTSESSNYTEKVESHDKMEKYEKAENL